MRSCGKATGRVRFPPVVVSVSVMEDLADEECVVPIFIRCPGHLCDDVKFGQIGGGAGLAGDRRGDGGR
ncbi:hypothetical protein GCM10010301_50710 [Streptomyces plicatus]|nr:hypothetical protein GCM10010301_50710 [Streptomyces plicatus]